MLPTRRRSGELWRDPFTELQRDFDRMLGRHLGDWGGDGGEDLVGSYPVDIREDENNVYVDAELPGFNKDDVEVTLENGILTINAERKDEQDQQKKGEHHLTERRFRRVNRSFALPNTVDESNVNAELDNGVLHLTLQKKEEVKPRRIQVK